MNTKFKINRQVVLTIVVLLTAMWLPLTTFAQGFSKTGDLSQDTNIRVKNHSHDLRDCHHSHDALTLLSVSGNWVGVEIVGFAEAEPTVRKTDDVVAVLQTSNHLVEQISVGFSETDPASNQFPESVTVLSASNSPILETSVGFSETDPSKSLYQSIGKLRSQHLVNCHGENAKGEVSVTPKFSNLAETGTQHEIS